MAIWHLGEGRHKEKLRAAALSRKGDAGDQVSWTFPFPTSIPPFPEGCARNQCRARPSLGAQGGLYPSQDGEQEWVVLRKPPSRRVGMQWTAR
jgi:hypothetical protein